MSRIAFPETVFEEMKTHLHEGRGESFGFLLANVVRGTRGPRFCVRSFVPVDQEDVQLSYQSPRRIALSTILDVVNEAKQEDLAIVEVHNHPGVEDGVQFSQTDEAGFRETVPYMLDALGGRPYAALVVGETSIDARYWEAEGPGSKIENVTVAGESLRPIRPTSSQNRFGAQRSSPDRFDRQIMIFGEAGQRRLSEMRVAVVGLGGIGSHVVQQLAHAGVRSMVLIDDDTVEESNLNRLIGATPDDVGRPKTKIAQRQVSQITGGEATVISPIQANVQDEVSQLHLATADLVLGCLDNDGASLIVNQLAKQLCLPYLDLGTGIHVSEDGDIRSAGGHLALVTPDGPCLTCMDLIDRQEAQYFLSSPEDRQDAQERGYTDGWDLPDPSVVGLNGTVASMAVDRVLEYSTRLDTPPSLEYYYMQGEPQRSIRTRRVDQDSGCYTCSLASSYARSAEPDPSDGTGTTATAMERNNGGVEA